MIVGPAAIIPDGTFYCSIMKSSEQACDTMVVTLRDSGQDDESRQLSGFTSSVFMPLLVIDSERAAVTIMALNAPHVAFVGCSSG